MNLHEYQAKQLLAQYGLPVPTGYVCQTIKEVEETIEKLNNNGPWVVKCQVHAGGRGKAGGVKIIDNKNEVKIFAQKWLGKRLITNQTNIYGQPVNQILIEIATDIHKELYLGVIIDRTQCRIVFIASTEGGIDIEKVAIKTPELIYKIIIDPLTGPMPYQGRELGFKLGLNNQQIKQFTKIFLGLATIFNKYNLTLIEINPLVITKSMDLICLDSKLSVDNNALIYQKFLQNMRDITQEDSNEVYASKWDLNYIALNGNIGCMVNGAGLAMATMDLIQLYGGSPANFLDVGGSTTKEKVAEAFKIILSDINVKVVLINIFGGIVRCDLIANGIIRAIEEIKVEIPVIVRLEGNNAILGSQILTNSGLKIVTAKTLIDAVKTVVTIAEMK